MTNPNQGSDSLHEEELSHPWVTGPTSPYVRVGCQACESYVYVARAWLTKPEPRDPPYILCVSCLRIFWRLDPE